MNPSPGNTPTSRFEAVIASAVDAIITINSSGTILECNPATTQLFGYSPNELIGNPIETLMPDPYKTNHASYLQNYERSGTPRIIGIGREVNALHQDGHTFPVHLAVSEAWVNGERLYTGIIRDLSERKRLEQDLVTRSERERAELGQELHDVLAQQLTAMSLLAKTLQRKLTQEQSPLEKLAEQVVDVAQQAMEESRRLAHNLYPTELERRGLWVALSELAATQEKIWQTAVKVTRTGPEVDVNRPLARHLYRIAQEAITNSIKHGAAQDIALQVEVTPDELVLEITDNGKGFSADNREGMGLSIMRYRASMIGAQLKVTSELNQGCTVVCSVPYSGEESAS